MLRVRVVVFGLSQPPVELLQNDPEVVHCPLRVVLSIHPTEQIDDVLLSDLFKRDIHPSGDLAEEAEVVYPAKGAQALGGTRGVELQDQKPIIIAYL